MAKLAPTSLAMPEWDHNLPFDQQPEQIEFDKLLAVSDNLDLENGEIVGGLLRWQRGDGYAWYLVTSEKPLTLQHVAYGDCWTIEDALIRGLRKDDVFQMLHRAANMRQIFGGKK